MSFKARSELRARFRAFVSKKRWRIDRKLVVFVALLAPVSALAHVKWFSRDVGYADAPLSLSKVLSSSLIGLAILSMFTVAALALADDRLQRAGWYQRTLAYLRAREPLAPAVLRVATGLSLTLSWQAGVLLAPELLHSSPWVEWFQVLLILCAFDARTTPLTGAGILVLYILGINDYGLFHMLDYAAFLGVAYYLSFATGRVAVAKRFVKPALFGTTGLSLAWLAMEKLVFPHWSLVVLTDNPELTLGLPAEFFLVAAAMVEFSLGYLLFMGVLGRPLAALVTLVFFSTTAVFGKTEVIGHALLHGVLIVFMLEGTRGYFRPPFRLESRRWLRAVATGVLFALVFAGFVITYQRLAKTRHVPALHGRGEPRSLHEVRNGSAPGIRLRAEPASDGGWDLSFELENFTLGKTNEMAEHREGEGHIHLSVDGQPKAMVFTKRYHLPPLPAGEHCIAAELSTNEHRLYAIAGRSIRAEVNVVQTATGGSSQPGPSFTADDLIYFEPLPARLDTESGAPSKPLVELGRMLFYDARLSKNQDVSCAGCHPLESYGVDNLARSPGHLGQLGLRNTPTVYNAGHAIAQFWDGRAEDLEEQAMAPLLNPVEMALANAAEVIAVLSSMPGYRSAFAKAFPNEAPRITLRNVGVAIGAFERGLTTPGRFDSFLRGDPNALSAVEREGLRRFMDLGCATCHNGPALGGMSFQRVGLVVPYDTEGDAGRFGLTHKAADKRVFKVPSLRNILKTAPYFHDGRYERLEEAVTVMARHQLGKTLSTAEVDSIVAFLGSLTGEIPTAYIRRPELPASTAQTPAPRKK